MHGPALWPRCHRPPSPFCWPLRPSRAVLLAPRPEAALALAPVPAAQEARAAAGSGAALGLWGSSFPLGPALPLPRPALSCGQQLLLLLEEGAHGSLVPALEPWPWQSSLAFPSASGALQLSAGQSTPGAVLRTRRGGPEGWLLWRGWVRPAAPVPRLDGQSQAPTLVQQIFGGSLRSRGECWCQLLGLWLSGLPLFWERC